MWFSAAVVVEVFLLAIQFTSITQARPANVLDNSSDSGIIAGEYIVVLKDLADGEFEKHISWALDLGSKSRGGPSLIETYKIRSLRAYHGSFDRETIGKIAISPEVRSVVPPFHSWKSRFLKKKIDPRCYLSSLTESSISRRIYPRR